MLPRAHGIASGVKHEQGRQQLWAAFQRCAPRQETYISYVMNFFWRSKAESTQDCQTRHAVGKEAHAFNELSQSPRCAASYQLSRRACSVYLQQNKRRALVFVEHIYVPDLFQLVYCIALSIDFRKPCNHRNQDKLIYIYAQIRNAPPHRTSAFPTQIFYYLGTIYSRREC